MEDEIRKTAVSDIGVYYFSAEKQHIIVDRFEKECSCWTKAGGNPPPAKKSVCFFSLPPPPTNYAPSNPQRPPSLSPSAS